MLDARQLVLYVIRPTLKDLGLYSKTAEQLVLGTGLVESHLTYISQKGNDIAKGLFQMETFTHDDLWKTTINTSKKLRNVLQELTVNGHDLADQMRGNLYYAAAMCRIHYFRIKSALPKEGDVQGMAEYWKKYYNTIHGAGKVEDFLKHKDIIINATKD